MNEPVESPDFVLASLRSTAEEGRAATSPVDVGAAVAYGNRRRRSQRRHRQTFSFVCLAAVTGAVVLPAVVGHGRAKPVHPAVTVALPSRLAACRSDWLSLSVWSAGPPAEAGHKPPTQMNDVARVDASGHTCELPAGWLSVRPIRRRGSLYAKVEQKNVGHGAAIELSPERFGVASVKLRIPWFIPDGNLCASGVGIGMTPPGSSKSFPSMIYSQCGVGLIGVLQATVSPFHAISSGVPHATGVSVARLQPGPMALGPNGILYFSEPALNQVVARLADGSFKLIAGTGKRGDSGDGGRAVRAMLADPQGIALAANGTLYIADFGNNRVRAVLPDGTIETVAGDGGKTPVNFPPNGPPSGRPALQVNVVSPSAVAIGPDGSLYVAATNDNAIVEVRNGVLTNVVTGRDLGALQRKENTRICGPAGLVFDTLGDLYFDCADASSLLMRTPAGQVIYRGSMQGPGFSGLSGAGGDQVGLTLGKIVFLKPAGGEAETLPTVVAGIGAFSPQGIAIAANGTIYLDQGYDPYDAPSGNDPPAIVAVQSGKISTLWAADT